MLKVIRSLFSFRLTLEWQGDMSEHLLRSDYRSRPEVFTIYFRSSSRVGFGSISKSYQQTMGYIIVVIPAALSFDRFMGVDAWNRSNQEKTENMMQFVLIDKYPAWKLNNFRLWNVWKKAWLHFVTDCLKKLHPSARF